MRFSFFGMEVKHPSTTDLALAAAMIVVMAIAAMLAHYLLELPAASVWPMVCAFSVGTLLSSFGMSVSRYGMKALVVNIVVAAVLGLAFLT